MQPTDKRSFLAMLEATAAMYAGQKIDVQALAPLYWEALEDFLYLEVKEAVRLHVRDPEHGQFFPRVADIVRRLEGSSFTPDQVLALARANNCPLGALFRIQIGSWDLDKSTDQFYLRSRAQECIEALPALKSRAIQGAYTDHELRVFAKHGIDCGGPVAPGLPAPRNPHLRNRTQALIRGPEYARLIAPPETKPEDSTETRSQAARQARQQLQRLLATIPDGSGSTTA